MPLNWSNFAWLFLNTNDFTLHHGWKETPNLMIILFHHSSSVKAIGTKSNISRKVEMGGKIYGLCRATTANNNHPRVEYQCCTRIESNIRSSGTSDFSDNIAHTYRKLHKDTQTTGVSSTLYTRTLWFSPPTISNSHQRFCLAAVEQEVFWILKANARIEYFIVLKNTHILAQFSHHPIGKEVVEGNRNATDSLEESSFRYHSTSSVSVRSLKGRKEYL